MDYQEPSADEIPASPRPVESSPPIDRSLQGWSRRQVGPILGMLVVIVTGMTFSLLWEPLVYHSSSWLTPGDLWGTYRASQYVTWGGESQIYNMPASFQTFPGIAVVLAPVAKVAGIFHLSASAGLNLPRPSTWWLLGPIDMALGSTLLFPLDTLAGRLGVASRRRVALLVLETALIWPSVVLWGHPEDALSLALAIYGLLAAADRAWFRVGVFFGCAIAVQPLVLLLVPLALAFIPLRRWLILSVEMLTPSVLLLLAPLIQEWGPTTRILLKQPNFVGPNHPTPWVALAPVIERAHVQTLNALKHVKLSNGHYRAVEVAIKIHTHPVVAAGPGRIVAIVIALLIGALVKVRQPSLAHVTWLAALALSLRCVFEPVMVPYYLLPGLVLLLIAASQGRTIPLIFVGIMVALCTWASYFHLSPWSYYIAIMVPLSLALALSWPSTPSAATQLRRVVTS